MNEPTEETTGPRVEVLGVRHHGPGSARAVRAALDALQPDAVLIEGPADADPLCALVGDAGMRPPVALLAYAANSPDVAVFWPFAVFSPEWQALNWAVTRGITVRFCDLPSTMVLADRDQSVPTQVADTTEVRRDPLAALALAAGYDDPERWWDDVIESRRDGPAPFAAVAEAMAELRTDAPALPFAEQQREAHIRQVLRATLKTGAQRVAVVCGAWHTPALTGQLPSAGGDAKLLAGVPKRKTAITWVPWTHSRLVTASGYGAGVTSPGWYHHLFTAPDRPITRWLTDVARVLRTEDLPVSSAHVIEAVRLADTLAALRGRPLAGLAEVSEATQAVLCDGDDGLLEFVTQRLVIGETLGAVPEHTPTVPLETDLRGHARRLRLKQEPLERALDLDLRRPVDADRSRLLHRLILLGVPWGLPTASPVRGTGTFRETWALRWRPELAVAVVEASMWGTTVQAAARAKTAAAAADATTLAELTTAIEGCLLADLGDVLPDLLGALDARAALDLDLAHLMEALPALVRAQRYGDVRGTDTSALSQVVDGLLVRICAGLPAALTALDDDAATEMLRHVNAVHAAVALAEHPGNRERWLDGLAGQVDRSDLHGLLAGRITRLLRNAGRLDAQAAATRLARALSIGATPAAKAAWVEGFLAGGGLLLVHDNDLLTLLNDWVTALDGRAFTDVLPLLRRTFGSFAPGERRIIADRVRHGFRAAGTAPDDGIDERRAAVAVATVAQLLGIQS